MLQNGGYLELFCKSVIAVFIRIGNKVAPVPIAHATELTECYLHTEASTKGSKL